MLEARILDYITVRKQVFCGYLNELYDKFNLIIYDLLCFYFYLLRIYHSTKVLSDFECGYVITVKMPFLN